MKCLKNINNKNGTADDNEWHYGTEETFKYYKEHNINLDLTLNANGTGFLGNTDTDSMQFNWVTNAGGNTFTKNISDNSPDDLFFGKSGELIEKSTHEITAAGQKSMLTAFEMFKKY